MQVLVDLVSIQPQHLRFLQRTIAAAEDHYSTTQTNCIQQSRKYVCTMPGTCVGQPFVHCTGAVPCHDAIKSMEDSGVQ